MDKAQKVILTGMCQISNGDEILVQYKVSRDYSGVTLREALIKCGLKKENLKSDIDKLIDIGVLKEYQRKKSDPIRYHIPDIYLKGMKLTRKGYK